MTISLTGGGRAIPGAKTQKHIGDLMQMKEKEKERTYNFLRKALGKGTDAWSYEDSPDPRQQKKVRHSMSSLLWALEFGMLSCQQSLRDVEQMIVELGSWGRKVVPEAISDTTLATEAARLDPDYLLKKLVGRIREFHRSKMLAPVGLPCGVVTVDGKNLATVNHDANTTAQRRTTKNEKWHLSKADETFRGKAYWLMPALRAVLTSAEAKLCVHQVALPPKIGESTVFAPMVQSLHRAYGRSGMFRIIDGDAGLTSLKNANVVVEHGYDYVFGLKGNQAELFREAEMLFADITSRKAPKAETDWEVRGGKKIRRRLWRSDEMAGMENSVGKWTHLAQTWLVRQETMDKLGHIETEDRFFITSLPWDYLKPTQILLLVRNHWAVENDCFNSLDMQWHEDSAPWCTQGTAIWALGLLRLLAYNTAQILRRRRLRPKTLAGAWLPPMSWRRLFKVIEKALELDPIPMASFAS